MNFSGGKRKPYVRKAPTKADRIADWLLEMPDMTWDDYFLAWGYTDYEAGLRQYHRAIFILLSRGYRIIIKHIIEKV